MEHDAKMTPSKIKQAFVSRNSSTKDDDEYMTQDDKGDVGGSQTLHSTADFFSITGCGDSSGQVINSSENDGTSDEMKRERAADDGTLVEKKEGRKFGKSWPTLLESTDQHGEQSPKGTTKCSTPGQIHVEGLDVSCREKDTRKVTKDGSVQTVLSHSQQEICQDRPEMERQKGDNKQIVSNCHPIPVIQPAFVYRTTDSKSYQSTQGGAFSAVHNNVNIPVRLECSTESRDSCMTDRSEVQNVSHEDNYSREANSQGLELVTNPPPCQPVSTVYDYAFLNLINEGTYGVVYKAMHKKTGNVVAIKMLKSENQPQGVSSTGLREVNIMLKARHINVISLREVVYGNNADKVYLVMEYAETDLKQLMYNMQRPFSVSETKCLLVQLLYAIQYLHDNAILHRDIKTENLLVNFNGILKVTDFGLARTFRKGDKHLSPVVVTLWYRAPELLLGSETYSTPVDLWSVGCVFAELLIGNPFWDGESEIDQLHQIFSDLGTPSEKIWPGYSRLPFPKTCILPDFPYNRLRRRLGWTLTELGLHLLNWFLTYSPARRVTAVQALQHWYFQEVPIPVDPQFLAGQVFRTPVIYPQCFAQGSGEPQPAMVYSHPANINYAHG